MEHIPVLLRECIEGLAIKPEGIYLDGTLGRAGHSFEIARRLKGGRLIAVDKDAAAIENAGKTLAPYADAVTLVQDDFRNVGAILDRLGIDKVDGMLFDLGVSSPQLDDPGRGFSYMADAPLDMRMDITYGALTAYDVVNTWPEDKLRRILYEYGEERHAGRIAARIVSERERAPIETTLRLVEVIRSAMPAKALREKQHPAKRTFQAIRIAVNDELGAIREMLETAPDRLNIGGRLCVISFHSLEDRLVKEAFLSRVRGCTCPPDLPVCACGFKQTLRLLPAKPIVPSEGEIKENPRSRSAKLRVAERV
jgi:16S rRNA (cytosine1402-N4)-methyltransferase